MENMKKYVENEPSNGKHGAKHVHNSKSQGGGVELFQVPRERASAIFELGVSSGFADYFFIFSKYIVIFSKYYFFIFSTYVFIRLDIINQLNFHQFFNFCNIY